MEPMISKPSSSVQSLSRVRLVATPWTAARQAFLSITNSWSPPKPMSTESVMPFNHLLLCHPLFLLPSIFASIRVFSNESAHPTPNAGVEEARGAFMAEGLLRCGPRRPQCPPHLPEDPSLHRGRQQSQQPGRGLQGPGRSRADSRWRRDAGFRRSRGLCRPVREGPGRPKEGGVRRENET